VLGERPGLAGLVGQGEGRGPCHQA
jgi:hypothetical protein